MYWDLITQIRNAVAVRRKALRVPFSKMDFAVAKVLVEAGYAKEVRKRVIDKKSFLDIDLFPYEERAKTIERVRFISKPSQHVHVTCRELKPVRQGYGLGVISTSQGVMTAGEAKKRRLGGEYLFEIW